MFYTRDDTILNKYLSLKKLITMKTQNRNKEIPHIYKFFLTYFSVSLKFYFF